MSRGGARKTATHNFGVRIVMRGESFRDMYTPLSYSRYVVIL